MVKRSKQVRELINKRLQRITQLPKFSMQFAVQERKLVLRFLILLVEHLQWCKNSLFIYDLINCN